MKNIFMSGAYSRKPVQMSIVISLLIMLFGTAALASVPALIGGLRNGSVLGLMFESGPSNYAKLRMGAEINSSDTPVIVVFGGKWFLNNINNRYPMFMSGGVVSYMGSNSEAGPYLSLIFEQFIDVTPMFLEIGIDAVRTGRLQCQVGMYF